MTYFYELGQVITRAPDLRSGTLVFDGTRVPVEALLDALQRGQTPKEFLSAHPAVFPEQVRAVATCWEDILRDADSLEATCRRLLAHADWALISERVARRIDAQAGDARVPPDVETLAAWAEDVARELGGGSGTEHVEQGTAGCSGEGRRDDRDEAERLVDAPFGAETEDHATETAHALTDAASNLRTAAEKFQRRRPIHAAHARRLAEDVERIITDLRQAGGS